jgi:hypothetical protein
MRKTRYSDVLCKAEALATDPKNLNRKGELKPSVQRKLNRMTFRIAFLSQFETQIQEYNNN